MSRVSATPPLLPNGNGHPNAGLAAPSNDPTPSPSENGPNPPLDEGVANYTLQGVMQWLNGEYRRYERDRNAWQIERSYLVVCILAKQYIDGVGSSGAFDGSQVWTTEV
jgi:Striatin family